MVNLVSTTINGQHGLNTAGHNLGLLSRTAIAFVAICFFWRAWLFDLAPLNHAIWLIVRLIDPTSLPLVSVGMVVLASALSLLLALSIYRSNTPRFVRFMVVFGLVLDVVGIVVFGVSSRMTWVWLGVHLAALVAIWWLTSSRSWRLATVIGATALVYAWLGTTPNLTNLPGPVLAVEYDPNRSVCMATVQDIDNSKIVFAVPRSFYDQFLGILIPQLVEDGYRGYNIIRLNSFYAIRQDEGAFDLGKFEAGEYTDAAESSSLGEVKRKIDAIVTAPATSPAPILAEEGYQGYNIIHLGDTFYAIRQDEGAFDLGKFEAGEYTDAAEGVSLGEVKWRIDAIVTAPATPPATPPAIPPATPPALVLAEEGYQGYNIIRAGDKFYAILQSDGAFSVEKFQAGGYTNAVEGNSLEEVEGKIDAMVANPQPVVQPDEQIYHGFRIEPWAGKYYAIPQAEGEFDIQRIENNDYSQYFSANSTDQIEELINGSILEGTRPIEAYDDYETLWRSEPGVTRIEETTIVKEGTSSLKVVWDNSQGGIYYNFHTSQSWYKSKYVSFYVYGANSGTTMALQIRFKKVSGGDWVDFRWTDDFSGWKRLVFELDNPANASGRTFWTDVRQVVFRSVSPHSATLYFDRLVWHK